MIDRTLNYGRHIIRQFLERSSPFQTVLDLGAGSGTDLDIAKDMNPAAKRLAIEFFGPNILRLRSRGIDVFQLNIERDVFPFNDESIDVIIANQVLEHTKELFWIMHESSRVLKKGGKLIIGVPNLASFHNRLLLLIGRQPTPIQPRSAHVRGFTRPGLADFLSIFDGFHIIDCKGSNFYPFPAFLAKPLARMFPLFAWGIFLNIDKRKKYSGEFINYLEREKLETLFYSGRQT